MKTLFEESVRGAAFRIDLSKPMTEALMCFESEDRMENIPAPGVFGTGMGTLRSLERRGLIYWERGETIAQTHGPYITPAGEHVRELLRIAGYGS